MKVNEFRVKGLPQAVKDTVRYTHQGPILYDKNQKPFFSDLPIGHSLALGGQLLKVIQFKHFICLIVAKIMMITALFYPT